jgi:23S rRNA (uracil1939-C5)-methyltransferase
LVSLNTERELATLRLGGFDSHGTTRARLTGRSIEVEHGIPDETVTVEIFEGRRPRGRIVDLLDPAPDRVDPPCEYFRGWACGGCQWQHISYEGQLERKRQGVEAAMRSAGLPFSVTATHALDDPWRYRSTAGIALGKRAGFRRHGSLAIVPIRDCPISDPLIGRLMADLNDRIAAGALPDFHGRVRLEVRAVDSGLHLLVQPGEDRSPPPGDLTILLEALTALRAVEAVSLRQPDGSIRAVSGPRFGQTTIKDRPLWLSAGSFFQTNLRLLPVLIDRILAEARPLHGKRAADVYGGVGVFGLFLSDEVEEVTVIESDPLAVEAGRLTAAEWGRSNLTYLPQTAEEGLAAAGRFDVVLLDPPRAGLSEPVLASLVRERPPLILYVSCLSQSLARDLIPLTGSGYSVEHLELFDFYPQTYHVEVLAVLRDSDTPLTEEDNR